MNYSLTDEEVQTLNKNHKHYYDFYEKEDNGIIFYDRGVIYSRVTEVKNDTFYLEIFISEDWKKSPKETATLYLNDWLNSKEELRKCKYFKATLFMGRYSYLQLLSTHYFEEYVDFIVDCFEPSDSKKMGYSLSNIPKALDRLKRLLNGPKHYPFNTTIYKIYLELDLQFYDIDLNSFLRVKTYEEADYYNHTIIGLPTILKIELADDNGFIEFPYLKQLRLSNYSNFAVMTFEYTTKTYNTRAVLNVRVMELHSIEIYNFRSSEGTELIAKADKQKLREINFIK